MAVLQGARLRTGALPAAQAAPARASAPASTPAAPRVRPMGKLMAAIVIATMLGLAYLTQTLGTSATSAEIRSLQLQQGKMKEEIGRHTTLVLKKVGTDELRTEARRQGLKKLPKPVILDAP